MLHLHLLRVPDAAEFIPMLKVPMSFRHTQSKMVIYMHMCFDMWSFVLHEVTLQMMHCSQANLIPFGAHTQKNDNKGHHQATRCMPWPLSSQPTFSGLRKASVWEIWNLTELGKKKFARVILRYCSFMAIPDFYACMVSQCIFGTVATPNLVLGLHSTGKNLSLCVCA